MLRPSLTLVLSLLVASACGRRSGGGGDDDSADGDSDVDADSDADGDADADADSGFTPDEALRAGVVLGSCLGGSISAWIPDLHEGVFVPYFGEPVFVGDWWIEPEAVRCLGRAVNGCVSLDECLGVRLDREVPCDDSCDGDLLVGCGSEFRVLWDCSRSGEVCDPDAVDCRDPGLGECDPDAFEEQCQSGRPRYCSRYGVVLDGPDCAELGLECAPTSDGRSVTCRGTEGSCDLFLESDARVIYEGHGCSDDVLETCANGGELQRDCSQLGEGFSCFRNAETLSSYCGLGDYCSLDNWRDDCDGATVIVCNMGEIARVDCTALGFSGCDNARGCTPNVVGD